MKYTCKTVMVLVLLFSFMASNIVPLQITTTTSPPQTPFNIASGEGWLSDWYYRRSITISGSSGAGTNYPVKIETYYSGLFSLAYDISWADNAHQGVTTDGTFVYTTNASMISKYQKDGTFVDSKDTTADRTYSALGDLCYYDGYLYVIDHDGSHPAQQKAMKYLASDLSYITSYSLNDYYSSNSGSANIAYGNGSFWTLSDWIAPDTFFEVHRYDLSWTYQENWTTEAFSMTGSFRYQGFDWIDENHFITVSHEQTEPNKIDFYYFDGTTFINHMQLDRPEWTGEDSSTYEACQGLAIEIDGDTTYVWFASRNNTGGTELGEVARYILSTESENYQIDLDENCQTDFGDIRFTDVDGITELHYWMEEYSSNFYAMFWVNVTDNLDSDVVIYLYSGTSGTSSTTSNGADTFLFYEDWESESIRDSLWDVLDTDGSVSWSAVDATHGTVLKMEGNDGSNKYQIISDAANGYVWPASVSFRTRSNLEKTVASSQIIQLGFQNQTGSARLQIKSYQDTYYAIYIADDDGNVDSTSLAHDYWDTYYTYEVARNGTYARFWVDNVFIGEVDNSPDVYSHILNFYVRDAEYDLYNDWVLVRTYIHNEPEIFSSGAEEGGAPQWEYVDDAKVYFNVPFDMWGFNTGLILLGLIMIPTSSLYLAYGVKHDRSSNRLYYGIIIFLVGCGLFVGGILPP